MEFLPLNGASRLYKLKVCEVRSPGRRSQDAPKSIIFKGLIKETTKTRYALVRIHLYRADVWKRLKTELQGCLHFHTSQLLHSISDRVSIDALDIRRKSQMVAIVGVISVSGVDHNAPLYGRKERVAIQARQL
jgi:hypothetical protein